MLLSSKAKPKLIRINFGGVVAALMFSLDQRFTFFPIQTQELNSMMLTLNFGLFFSTSVSGSQTAKIPIAIGKLIHKFCRRASVLDCGGPPPLFRAPSARHLCGFPAKQISSSVRSGIVLADRHHVAPTELWFHQAGGSTKMSALRASFWYCDASKRNSFHGFPLNSSLTSANCG